MVPARAGRPEESVKMPNLKMKYLSYQEESGMECAEAIRSTSNKEVLGPPVRRRRWIQTPRDQGPGPPHAHETAPTAAKMRLSDPPVISEH